MALLGLSVILSFGHCALVLVEARTAQIHTQLAADAAALAAAGTDSGCVMARKVAERNRSVLISCTRSALAARVVVRGSALRAAPWIGRPSARAHAGFR